MKAVNIWIAFSSQAITEFKARRSDSDYDGPMDDTTFKVMSHMADLENRQRLYKQVPAGGKTYTLFSLLIEGNLSAAKDAVDHITAEWPSHIIMVGAWFFDTGLQVGTSHTYDDEGNVTGITGTPMYPLPATAYKVMPDVVTYTESGEVDTVTPASSNADLKDINLVYGQAPRVFA